MENRIIKIIFIACVIIVPVIIAGIACYCAYRAGKIDPVDKLIADNLYVRAIALNNKWLFGEFVWETVYIFLSVMPFILTLTILFLECKYTNVKTIVIVLSIISLSFMSIAYFLKPHNQTQVFRKAYEELRPLIIEYESCDEQTEDAKRKILDAIKEGEKYIGTAII